MISAFERPSRPNWSFQGLGLGLAQANLVDDDQRGALGLGRQRVLQRQRAHLLGQVMRVAAHHRAEGATAAAELRRACRPCRAFPVPFCL
jgi:hypothetical protein